MKKFRVVLVLLLVALLATLVACGEQDPQGDKQTFTVTFDTQGGSVVAPLTIAEGETFTLPQNPTKAGYVFDGWYLSTDFLEEFNATQTISSDITVYAKWKTSTGGENEKKSYTITFDTQGGSEIKPIVLKEGQIITLSANPTKEGYKFGGWYLDNSFVERFENNRKISSNMTLYAKWDCVHTPVMDAAVAPTCTETGLTEGSHCSRCNAVLKQQEIIAALGHDEQTHNAKKATCTEVGWDEYVTCSRCDYTTFAEKSALGHIGGQATCTRKAVCTRCHIQYGNLLVHDYGKLIAKVDPTCSTTGVQAHYACSTCHKIFKNDENKTETTVEELVIAINPDAHNFGVWIKDENADTHTRICARNGEHTQTEDCHGGETTCTEKAICEVCHAQYGNLLPHDYQHGVCTNCGDRRVSVGLEYSFNSAEGYYTVIGIGICEDNDIFIPAEYNSKPVTSIGDYAFYDCERLTSITIPDSVTSIGSSAFSGCKGLTSITIPNSVTSMGDYAFSDCTGLTSINGPAEMVSTVAKQAGPTSFVVNITSGDSIDNSAFYNCRGLTSITIPDSVTSIGDSAFYNCTGLTSMVIPDSVTSMGDYVFSGCSGLTSVTIGSGVTSIGQKVFSGCISLAGIVVVDENETYHSENNCLISTANKMLVVGCKNSVIPADGSVTSIGDYAFEDCTGLTSITIPGNVTSIGLDAFSDCYELIEVYNKSSLTITAGSTDNGYVAYYAKNVYTSEDGSNLSTDENGYVIYTDGTEKILVDYVGTETELILPSYVTQIYDYAFYYRTDLTSVVIPDSVTSLGRYAFEGCRGLTSVIIGSGLTSISYRAFEDCAGLTSIVIPDGVTNIGYSAFYRCTGLTSVVIPDSVTSIEASAFAFCSGLTSITIPNRVTIIGKGVFRACTGLTSIVIPNGVTSIERYTFVGCTGLTSITIPDSVTSIDKQAFSGCSGLTSIFIPDSVTSIGEYAFDGCTGLTSITIPDSVASIGDYAFRGCSGLTSVTVSENNNAYSSVDGILYDKNKTQVIHVPRAIKGSITIPDGVTSINIYAFYYCTGLTSITIPDSVTSIGNYAFQCCAGLTSITIPDSVTSIGEYAFYGCSGLTSVTIGSGVTSIGDRAFEWCHKLIEVCNKSSLTITAGSTDNGCVAYYAKNVCTSEDGSNLSTDENGYVIYTDGTEKILVDYVGTETELILPSYVTQIYDYVFYFRTDFTSMVIPDSVTCIGDSAFSRCTKLTSITIGNGVTSINIYAFYGCSGLTSVTIGSGVASIGESAFSNCTGLTSIDFDGTMAQWNAIEKDGDWTYGMPSNCKVICTDGELSL